MTEQTLANEVVIACDPNAVPADKREHWLETGKQVYAAVQEVRELPNGYQFRLPTDSTMLLKVADYITNERLCCAFLRFTLEVEPNIGPFWLQLTGREGVKEYLRSTLATNDLLDEQVAQAAGLR
ncbi:MAG TPA: hypothetical protein VMP08_11105 [Anaerolineae bacterium]|nr:hypothetical protein [Anaerolineae bacterium]